MKKTASTCPLLRASLAMLALTLLATSLPAAIPPITPGETTLFSDDFADNSNKWTGITAEPLAKHAVIAGSFWGPSIASDGQDVSSNVTLPAIIDLAGGPISVYFRMRVENPKGLDGSRTEVTIRESTGNGFVALSIRPVTAVGLLYRDAAGKGARTNIGSTRPLFKTPETLVTIKLTITHGKDKLPATAEAFYYDEAKSAYVSLGKIENVLTLNAGGKFNRITLFSRNADKGASWFDSIAVTQRASE